VSQTTHADPPDPAFRSLYRVAGVAALIVALLTVTEIAAFVLLPQPDGIQGWFALFQDRPIAAILDFWGLELPMYAMFLLVFLGLYFALRERNKSGMAIALTFVCVGAAVFFATNNAFSMLSLSNQYATATTEARRSALLAAGEAILANTNQRAIGGFNIGLFLVSIAGLIVSAVMRSAPYFGRFTAWLGVTAFALSLADYLRQALTRSVAIALAVIIPGALAVTIWFAAVGLRLLRQPGAEKTVRVPGQSPPS
jgi:hypothetical protein